MGVGENQPLKPPWAMEENKDRQMAAFFFLEML